MNLSTITLKRSFVAYTLIIITLCVSKEVQVPYYAHLLYTRKSLETQNFTIFCYNCDMRVRLIKKMTNLCVSDG